MALSPPHMGPAPPPRPPPLPGPRRRGRGRGCLVTFLLLAAAAAATLVTIVAMARRHPSEWPDAVAGVRLEPAVPPLSENAITPENAVYWLRRIRTPDTAAPEAEIVRFRRFGAAGAPYPGYDAAMAAARPHFEAWVRAASCLEGRHPTVDSVTGAVAHLSAVVSLARWECYRAEMAWEAGRRADSLESLRRISRNADAVARGGLFLHHRVRIAVLGDMLRSVRRMALATESADDLAGLDVIVHDLRPNPADLAEGMRQELAFVRKTVRLVYSSPGEIMVLGSSTPHAARLQGGVLRGLFGLTRSAGSTPDSTLAHVDAVYSHLIGALEGPFAPEALDPILAFLQRPAGKLRTLADDPVGRMVLSMGMPDLGPSWRQAADLQAAASATRAVLSVRRFQVEKGALPETLARVQDGAPEDPYLPGGLMVLRRDGTSWGIYSVGADRTSDRGSPPPHPAAKPHGSDLVFGPAEFH